MEWQYREPMGMSRLHSIVRSKRRTQFTAPGARGRDPRPRPWKTVAPYPHEENQPARARPGTKSRAAKRVRKGRSGARAL
ncbi:hypothetical protein M758_5G122500 [Ceratodon purpureus]|nr:hypothetical protein M758_5G122500 [Ceratodon purpureus]